MKSEPSNETRSLSSGTGEPTVCRIPRRRFIAIAGAAVALTGGAVAGLKLLRKSAAPRGLAERFQVGSPDHPSQNPAFAMLDGNGDDLILYVNDGGQRIRAFSLNKTSQLVYSLCDGQTTVSRICEEYGRTSGRQRQEALDCIARLVQNNLVLQDKYIQFGGWEPQPTISPARKWRRL